MPHGLSLAARARFLERFSSERAFVAEAEVVDVDVDGVGALEGLREVPGDGGDLAGVDAGVGAAFAEISPLDDGGPGGVGDFESATGFAAGAVVAGGQRDAAAEVVGFVGVAGVGF